ncbi:hypothetical protein AAFF_G00436830 [Aldrovandia affinis]|uniref:Uncharacterized protein n=1 Tax=Aldrovandia affinis TaxID=143900 RepID=A0AAD7S849_9TELE|nr:hypothetical protein AAFF_G00436830 [Aldrovandia affinis]
MDSAGALAAPVTGKTAADGTASPHGGLGIPARPRSAWRLWHLPHFPGVLGLSFRAGSCSLLLIWALRGHDRGEVCSGRRIVNGAWAGEERLCGLSRIIPAVVSRLVR